MASTPIINNELWYKEDNDSTGQAKQRLAALLAKLEAMKPFPVVAQRLIAMLNDPNFKIAEVIEAIENDPPLAANVLRVSNSALFGALKPSTSIGQSIIRLGARAVQEMVISAAVTGLFKDVGGVGKKVRDHCIVTAAIIRVLAREFSPTNVSTVFLCGLMHDIGKLLMIQAGIPYDRIIAAGHFLVPDLIHQDERAQLGYDHAVLGGHVMALWKIPTPIPAVVAWHHQNERASKDQSLKSLVALLRFADQLEPLLQSSPKEFDEAIVPLGTDEDACQVGISLDRLERLQVVLYKARKDALDLFG
jgi:putative nucleotidyltransferase with HDIG domain